MTNKRLKQLNSIFKRFPQVKLVYFFGSRAAGRRGPLSDYDFAFYLDEKNHQKMFEIKFNLIDKISRLLGTDKIDVVILNLSESPELKYQIIKDGRLIYERAPFRLIAEPKILNEYFDFRSILIKAGLTAA